MKKAIIGAGLLITCLGIVSVSAFAEEKMATAYRAENPVSIDGTLDDWNLSSPIKIEDASQIIRDEDFWMGENDVSCSIYVMWDEEKLYLAAEVKEASPFGAVGLLEHNMEDNFKVYISTNPDADPNRTEYDTNDFLVYLMMDNQNWYTAFDRSMIDRSKLGRFTSQGMEDSLQVLEGYEKGYTMTGDGFLLELAIPWSNFSNEYMETYLPIAGDTVNFDICITDNDYPFPNTQGSVQMSWCGTREIDKNPSLWGRLRFE